jgi:hypothetical protein
MQLFLVPDNAVEATIHRYGLCSKQHFSPDDFTWPESATVRERGDVVAQKKRTQRKSIENADQDSFLQRLGPGFITGASDDDPSGIGTYSQAGAALVIWRATDLSTR